MTMRDEQTSKDNVPAVEPSEDKWRIEDYCCGMPVWTKEPPEKKPRPPYLQEEDYSSH